MRMTRGGKRKPSKEFKRPWEGYDRDCFNVLRALRGMTNSHIAKNCDLSYTTIARLRNLQTLRPSHRTLVEVSRVAGLKFTLIPMETFIANAVEVSDEEAKKSEAEGLARLRAAKRAKERKQAKVSKGAKTTTKYSPSLRLVV